MAQVVSVVCPSCEAVLKVTKPSLIGKKVACPACNKPVRIQAHPEAAQKAPTIRKQAAEAPLAAARPSNDDLDMVLLADDDDPPSRLGAKLPAPSSSSVPIAKPRSSSVWKKMSATETAEFEAMLVDKDDEIDESTTELPFTESSQSSGSIRKRKRAGSDSNEMDDMLLDTNAEEDEITAGTSATRSKRKQDKPKSKPAVQSYTDEADEENDADGFDLSSESSTLEDDGFGATAPRLPRLPASVQSSGSTWNPKHKMPLYIGAVTGSALLMALLIYSISGTHAPPPLAESAPGGALAAAEEKEDSASATQDSKGSPAAGEATAKGNGSKTAASSNAASSNAGDDESGQGGGHKGVSSSSESSGDADHSPVGPKSVAAAVGTGGRLQDTASTEGSILGRKIPPFTATAVDKTTYQSADSKQKVLVVAFMGLECPLANLYYPRLVELAKKYKGKSVGFLAINSNAQDTLDDVLKQSRTNRTTFPVLKDAGNAVAKLFSAERTPEVFVLDAERVVRFHGMIDDQYGIRQRRSQPTKTYVIDAVDSLLSASTVSVAETPVQGCHIGRITQASGNAHTSFYRDVLPVLQNRCQQCHRKGEIGPFALKDFAEVREWGPTIREAVAERRMPPWPADPHFGKFSNDISLSEDEIATITNWVDEGCPEGNPAEKPPEKKFVDGWNIGKPDRVFTMEKPFHVPATGVIEYQHIYASPVFTQDTWVQAVECRFGNRTVVHHMLVLLDFPKDHSKSQDGLVKGFFAAGAPGSTYFTFPKGYAKKIPKGARLRFQMHYTPNGTATEDQSRFGIVLAKEPKEREVQTYALGKLDINIPAGNPDHMEFATQSINGDVILTTLMPHLHVRGKSFTFTVVWPNGKKEIILSVPHWDFNWQPQYQLVKPIVLTKGSQITVEAHWDNSADNPNNILPPVDVQFGEQTFDEMFIGYVNFIPKAMADASHSRGRKRGG
jgi:peroxiredoxin